MEKLDKYEREILESVENDQWESTGEQKKYIKYAKEAHKKNKRINIRINERDLVELKRIAILEGLPYQTMIASILHKFVNGRLREGKE